LKKVTFLGDLQVVSGSLLIRTEQLDREVLFVFEKNCAPGSGWSPNWDKDEGVVAVWAIE
jgi:hypothetical protein